MLELKIKIETPDLAAALERLAAAMTPAAGPTPTAAAAPAGAAQTTATVSPTPASATAASVVPTAPAPTPAAPAAPAALPTEGPKYTIDDIARAGSMLAMQGPEKVAALNGLLQQFGLATLTQLKPDQTSAFVQAMRGLGAQL